MTAFRHAAVVLGLVTTTALLSAGDYTSWTKDEKKMTYTCEYSYKQADTKAKEPGKQTAVIYYGDKDRSGWAYFYNADNKAWARCAVPGNPKYDAKKMTWEKLTTDEKGYEPFKDKKGEPEPAGYCPTPKDGKEPIPDLPLPPK